MERHHPPRKVKAVTLKRELGIFGSFSIGFADVGADVYVAVGLVIFFALGAAPLALAVAGLAYLFTALSYAELASAIPRAGGAAVFTREAFGDLVGFVAGLGLLLDYLICTALFSWFAMGYLGGLCYDMSVAGVPFVGVLAVLNPVHAAGSYIPQTVGTILLILFLLALNCSGIRRAARFNMSVIAINLVSLALLFGLGFLFAWSLPVFITNIGQLGGSISWGNFGWGVTLAMVSYIGLESISEAAEETRHPHRVIPRATMWLIFAVLAVTIIASTLCVGMRENIKVDGVYPSFSPFDIGTRFQSNPIAGLAAGIGTFTGSSVAFILLTIWVGFLAFTMVTISANTGVIGASRVTYSMGRFKLMPRWFGKVHTTFRVPHRTIIVFSLAAVGFVLLAVCVSTLFPFLEEPTVMLADLYSYGALIAFMCVNLALIKLRNKRPYLYRPWKQPFSIKLTRKGKKFEIPLLPLLGFAVCFVVWILVLYLHLFGRIVGTLWFLVGAWWYLIYRFRKKLYLNKPAETLITSPRVAHMLHPELADRLQKRYSKVLMHEQNEGG